MAKTVIELFASTQAAQRAVAALQAHGIDRSSITMTSDADDATLAVLLTTTTLPTIALQRYVVGVRQGGTLVVAVVPDQEASKIASLMTTSS